jgi:transposase
MGWAYSVDLRERVIAAFDLGDMTDEKVAGLFQVGEATVHRWKRLNRETGSVVPKPPRGGGMPPRVAPENYDVVRAMVKEEPDLSVPKMRKQSEIVALRRRSSHGEDGGCGRGGIACGSP